MNSALPDNVCRNGSGFRVRVQREGDRVGLGTFRTVEEAVRVAAEYAIANPPKTIRQRFDESWEPVPFCGCWIWTGVEGRLGYGQFNESIGAGKTRKHIAHRLGWELYKGTIPKGMSVCHKCDTPSCVNPDHMFLGVHLENMQDMARKGRGRKSKRGLPYGVGIDVRAPGWFKAKICHGGRQRYLGTFATPEEASAVALAEKERLLAGG